MPIFRKDGKNILFIHVPKTGGSTIERIFANSGYETLYRDPKTGPASANRLRKCSPQHMHAAMLEQILNLGSFDAMFMISREPLARFRSEYGMRNTAEMRVDAEAVDAWADRALRLLVKNPYTLDNHLRPQHEFYVDGSLVYRLEDGLDSVVADLNSRYGLGLDETIPQVMDRQKASGIATRDVQVSDTLARRVKALYRQDYGMFGYPA